MSKTTASIEKMLPMLPRKSKNSPKVDDSHLFIIFAIVAENVAGLQNDPPKSNKNNQ